MSLTDSILLVDDDRRLADSLSLWLSDQGYDVEVATSLAAANARLRDRHFDVVLTDLRLGDDDGLELVRHIRDHYPRVGTLALSGFASPEDTVEVIRAGAVDLLFKPLADRVLLSAIERVMARRRVAAENERLRQDLETRLGMEDIVSRDPRMLEIFRIIDSVADARASVLITGENGTGKSLIARAIHHRSRRREGPFIEVACGALPDTLLESELFGHVAGAYTGAAADRLGKFDLADGGTLFLDEIGTASPALQVKLLRVLQEFRFEPLGGIQTRRVDTRVILATNEDLAAAVAEGRFRQDLFYRINVVGIEVPPLRERPDDIPLLVDHFLHEIVKAGGRDTAGFDDQAMDRLRRYRWPGNIRQLENVVERAVLLGQGDRLTVDDLPPELTSISRQAVMSGKVPAGKVPAGEGVSGDLQPRAGAGPLRGALVEPERQIILRALRDHQWNRSATAENLGINRTTLYKKMKRLGLSAPR